MRHLGECHFALGVKPTLLDPHASEVNLKARIVGLIESARYGVDMAAIALDAPVAALVSHERTAPAAQSFGELEQAGAS